MTTPEPLADSETVPPEVTRFVAAHPAPASCADALVRDGQGRILLVDPVYKPGWDLPGGMTEDEGPARAVERELLEELGLPVDVGRLLAVDTIPADVYGRTLMAYIYAAHPAGDVDPAGLALQDEEIRAAAFFPEDQALDLLPDRLRRRLAAALEAERGAHTAVLQDGVPRPVRRRDHYALLPSPMMAATVVVTRVDGRVLVQHPSYKQHAELPGGMVEAHESPAEGGVRELFEELGMRRKVGRVLAVDSSSATQAKHGRAMVCVIFALDPLSDQEADALVLGEEVASVSWLTREEARRALPWRLAARMDAALDAKASGTTVHLSCGRPDLPLPGDGGAELLRAALVERLEAEAGLVDPLLREAFATVRRELVVPRGYTPRLEVTGTDEKVWQLLDGTHPSDRAEWSRVVYAGESVMLQLPGQDPRTTPRGHLAVGGGFASMTTDATGVVHLLQPLALSRGARVLEAGTGAGLVAAMLCEITGSERVTGIEVDPLLAQATRERLAAAGYRPRLLTGDALAGCPGEEFDAIVLSFSVRSAPVALLGQLAVGGTLIAPIHTGSPSWPAHCHVTRTEAGWEAVLRPYARGGTAPGSGQEYHRPPKPGTAPDQTGPGRRRDSRIEVPDPLDAAGFWLAVGHLLGIMRGAAPDEEQWMLHHRATGSRALLTAGAGSRELHWWGGYDLWADVEELHHRWEQAGRPAEYRLDLTDPAQQTVLGGTTERPLSWVLPGDALAPGPRPPRGPDRARTA
ncbi:NUDIX domain-containing protein [Streptacidiphilus sp. EB103A]|uniref:NUDIX domain-containing protein n=1 Tax=Streptacidiphilus sp. EB103A TaxID=3156275 RepID=UPI003519412A